MIEPVARMLAAEATEARLRTARAGALPHGWAALAAAGLPLALAPEAAGGLGLDAATVLALVQAHGAAGAPWPLAETLLANAALAAAGLPLTEAPATLAMAGWAADGVQLVEPPAGFDPLPLLAALHTAQIAGALASVLAMTLAWTQTREQFGKPLARNQAVQHELAKLAGEAAAAGAAVGLAAAGLAGGKPLAIAAAKARASEAAGQGAAIAHQLHGAIGVTAEHRLNLFTRALWQWRDAAGNEFHWQAVLGRAALAAGSAWQVATAA